MKVNQVVGAVVLAGCAGAAHGVGCNVASSGVAFGTYTPGQALPKDTIGNITVSCTKGALDVLPLTVTYTIDLTRGNSSSTSPRELRNGGNTLYYNLYTDPLRSSVWANAASGMQVSGSVLLPAVSGIGSTMHSAYGRIFASQNATPGAYSDSIVMTINY